jgi:hypothetical protein
MTLAQVADMVRKLGERHGDRAGDVTGDVLFSRSNVNQRDLAGANPAHELFVVTGSSAPRRSR